MKSRKLLLLALSGVRVRDRELMALGMTLPGFVERSKTIASLPSLGLLTLAGLTPSHWEIEYRDLDQWTETDVQRICTERPDLVAISALTARIYEAYGLADTLRADGLKVVGGGLHVSALPHEAAAHFDAVVAGEGERYWPLLLGDAERGCLSGIYSADTVSAPPFSFNDAPMPRYDLLDPAVYNRITLQTTRGCPHVCTFCAASRTISPWRQKPLELVRRDLEAILSIWPRPFLELADDNTFVDKRWSRDLARLLSEYPVRWFTETDISVADDPELLEILAQSGCAQFLIGLESSNRESLRGIDSRDWKYARAENWAEKVARIQSYGIMVNGCFTLGLDGDDCSVFDRTLSLVRSSGLAEVQITVLTPFPGTILYDQLARDKRLLKPVFWDECTLFDVTYTPLRMSVEELRAGFHRLMKELYSPEETAGRRAAFRRIARNRAGRNVAERIEIV